jgi:16S rRNA (guanine966-N2)-methyltransferase
VRVIAGAKKGVDLRCGRGPHFRPTAQVVKGSIFDTLGIALDGAAFLDLFAGSGSVGIEALSRGVARAVFVEQDHRILKALRTNIERCRFSPGQAEVRMGDAMRFLERLVKTGGFFDVIYADPPYAGRVAQRVVDAVAGARAPVCRVLVVEHGSPVFVKQGALLELAKVRHFGQTTVSYFHWRKEAGEGEGQRRARALSGDV